MEDELYCEINCSNVLDKYDYTLPPSLKHTDGNKNYLIETFLSESKVKSKHQTEYRKKEKSKEQQVNKNISNQQHSNIIPKTDDSQAQQDDAMSSTATANKVSTAPTALNITSSTTLLLEQNENQYNNNNRRRSEADVAAGNIGAMTPPILSPSPSSADLSLQSSLAMGPPASMIPAILPSLNRKSSVGKEKKKENGNSTRETLQGNDKERKNTMDPPITIANLLKPLSIFSVYDGHSGSKVARMCRDLLHKQICADLLLPLFIREKQNRRLNAGSGQEEEAQGNTKDRKVGTLSGQSQKMNTVTMSSSSVSASSSSSSSGSPQLGTNTKTSSSLTSTQTSYDSPNGNVTSTFSGTGGQQGFSDSEKEEVRIAQLTHAIQNAFAKIENNILQCSATEGWAIPCGSTALNVMIDSERDEYWIAHLGDSRAVLCRAGKVSL